MKFLHAILILGLALFFLAPGAAAGAQQNAAGGRMAKGKNPAPAVTVNPPDALRIRRAALPRLGAARRQINQALQILNRSSSIVESGDPHEAAQSLAQAQHLLQLAMQQVQAAREACATGEH